MAKTRITSKQKSARRRNIKIARLKKKKGGKKKSIKEYLKSYDKKIKRGKGSGIETVSLMRSKGQYKF